MSAPHAYLGKQWRADPDRSASYFPLCTCGWVGSCVSGLLEAGRTAEQEHAEHVAEATP